MNKLFITGNLVRDPELRTTPNGKSVCSFTVAVNRRRTQNNQNSEADYFRIAAWNELGESCSKYLAKGRKVGVVGPVSLSVYTSQNGETRANMEVRADEVEFLSPKSETASPEPQPPPQQSGFIAVETDYLPF